MIKSRFLPLVLLAALALAAPSRALDLTGGVMRAVPTPGGHAPSVDGDLSDWDLSGAEPVWMAPETARKFHAQVALMYDKDALYVGADVSLPARALRNPNNPVDAFWWGDVLELRVAADPALPAPLNGGVVSDRVAHLTFWKNSETGKDFLHIVYGVGLDRGHIVNPPGAKLIVRQYGTDHYVVEARIPWAALHAPGGTNPFAPGQKMTAVWSPHWGGETQVAALYRQNPGAFAFSQPQTWGQVEFSAAGRLAPRHETMTQLLARFAAPAAVRPGAPFTVHVPGPGLQVSVNILGPSGEVVRELMGGESHPPGDLTLRWDGHDQWGTPMPLGAYRWGAYFSRGLRARFVAGVGKTASPYYDTADGKGGWGADHSNPVGVAADMGGLYFLWPVAESGRAVVKTGYGGKVLWRKTPFVGGGFGPFYAVASGGKYLFLTFGVSDPQLIRLDAATGQTLTWGDAPDAKVEAPISVSKAAALPAASSPLGSQPESVGLAASRAEVFASVYSRNIIQVLDPGTGALVRTLACPGPRGVCLDARGDLYAVSYVPGRPARVLKFGGGRGAGRPVVTAGLAAPWGVAADAKGDLHVSDGGASQQVKTFSPQGRLLAAWGKHGGRAALGTYDPSSFRDPAGVAADARGGLLVAESSAPKVFSRWDALTGRPLARWFGGPSYWDGTWPDSDDPRTVYYQITGGFARANLSRPDTPRASWASKQEQDSGAVIPTVLVAKNGLKYLVNDVSPNAIYRVQGDQMRPVAFFRVHNRGQKGNALGRTYLEVWQDANGDGLVQRGEVSVLDTVESKPLAPLGDWGVPTTTMTASGDLYLETSANKILKIPAAGFRAGGGLRWNLARASYVVPTILPAFGDSMYVGPRGMAGLRVDGRGDLYTCFSANAPVVTPELTRKMRAAFPGLPQSAWGAYATQELADRMHEGLGHTGESNAVKFAKFAPDGRLLWVAGRKATAAAGPGEMYHFWALAGLLGDAYIAGASEWGPMYVYTQDGFFVDSLFNNPGLDPPPGPYTFGSETGAGRLQYFPKLDQLWAYSVGMAYRVQGFAHGRMVGESRASGTVTLDKVYEEEGEKGRARQAAPLQIVPVTGDPLADAGIWDAVPASILRRNGGDLATVQVGYDARNLYARLHVADDTPLQNAADRVNTAFKGGDTAGLVLGPAAPHDRAGAGDTRLMAAMIGGRPHLVAMQVVTAGAKNLEDYYTPSAGHARFDFVGDVPGGRVVLTPDADGHGYTALFAVPRSFLGLPLAPGASLSADAEVRLSGQGQQGPQTAARCYLFTPQRPETSMTSDAPTEARLYPQYWGRADVK